MDLFLIIIAIAFLVYFIYRLVRLSGSGNRTSQTDFSGPDTSSMSGSYESSNTRDSWSGGGGEFSGGGSSGEWTDSGSSDSSSSDSGSSDSGGGDSGGSSSSD